MKPGGRQRSAAGLLALALPAALAIVLFTGFAALGTWQVERRAWKLDLIARVDQRVHAPAAPAPGRDAWPAVTAANDEYKHVRLSGTFLHDKETLTQASTQLGAGFWVLTPLKTDDGSLVMVNRGFVPPEARERSARTATEPQGRVAVAGLLRLSEPKGGFLRTNDAAGDRWYSRDVAAIASARGLPARDVAPYFVDAESTGPRTDTPEWPAAGLTVIAFPNSHLVYAITWYGLALMVLLGAWVVWRRGLPGNGENAAHADAVLPQDARSD